MRKKQYLENGSLSQTMVDGVRCDCGCNVFHRETDGKDVFGVCNACGTDIYTYVPEVAKQQKNIGIWK